MSIFSFKIRSVESEVLHGEQKNQDRRLDGIEPLTFSSPTGLKPAPWTTRDQVGVTSPSRLLNTFLIKRHIKSTTSNTLLSFLRYGVVLPQSRQVLK